MTLLYFVVSCILSIVVHEAGHYIGALIFGIRVKGLKVNRYGFAVVRERGAWFDSMVVSAFGPLFNLAVAYILWGSIFEYFTLANIYMGVINLAPLKGSDGSHILLCMRKIEEHGNRDERVKRNYFVDDVRVTEILADLAAYPTQSFIVQAKTQAEAEKIYERVFQRGGDTSRLTISTYSEAA